MRVIISSHNVGFLTRGVVNALKIKNQGDQTLAFLFQ